MSQLELKKSVIYSGITHLFFIFLFSVLSFWNPFILNPSIKNNQEKEIVYFDLKETESNQKIVTTSTGEKSKEALKNAYLSDKNIKVEKESIRLGDATQVSQPKIKQEVKKAASEKSEKSPSVAQKEFSGSLSDLGVPLFQAKHKNIKNEDRPQWFDPSAQPFQNTPGGEYVEGVKEGEVTALNTKEYVFYSYFQRIRKQLDLSWKPILKTTLHKRMRIGRTLSSDMNHTTKTLVILNKAGEVIGVKVLEESGVLDLDGAAVEAFNKAGPFPNPPKGLMNQNGEIEVRWDFILRT